MGGKGIVRFGVSLPQTLLKEFDETITQVGYPSRSKAIHDAISSFITENRWPMRVKGVGIGSITLLYYHDVKGLDDTITAVEHEHHGVIASSMHVHLTETKCLKILAVKGENDEIRHLARRLSAMKGVRQSKVALVGEI